MRLIIILLCIYLLYKFTAIWVFPFMVKRYVRKTQERFFGDNPHLQKEEAKKKKGKITIKTPLKKKKKMNLDDVGDYTEFEELDK